MDQFEDYEMSTGWRGVFNGFPATKNAAQKAVVPLSYFYSPFKATPQPMKASPALCKTCKASINCFSNKNRNSRLFTCNFCGASNNYAVDIGLTQVQEYVESKVGDNGVFFMIDLCLSEKELNAVKETLVKTIKNMPRNIMVGMLCFSRNVFILDYESQVTKFTCLSGKEDYSTNKYTKLKETLNLTTIQDPRHQTKTILLKYYAPIEKVEEKLLKAINKLECDGHFVLRGERQKRASGCAFQVGIGLISEVGINTRFVSVVGGPCTMGVGQVVGIPVKNTIRSYVDIVEGNQNTSYMKSAIKFYDTLEDMVIKNNHTIDMWAYGLDQFGLLQMKQMVNNSGGLLAMQQEFNHYIFQTSFEQFYESNQDDQFNFPIACKLTIRTSKEIKINGIIGTCKSLKDNVLKNGADMEIGEGGTNVWYLGGIGLGNALCVMICNSQNNISENKQRAGFMQAITTYKYSDNIVRTRVSTINIDYLRENQSIEMGKRFDEQAAAVMLARMASLKSQVQDSIQVKKWVDRILLRFCVKFASYSRNDKNSFRLPKNIKKLPQFIYHLRRSTFINPFGSPPDQSIYYKTCMARESIVNGMAMIQPALLSYTVDEDPIPVELELSQLKQEVILLLDCYFVVSLWYGDNVQSWKQQNLHEEQQYSYLKQFFEIPVQDAREIIYDRMPCANYYETYRDHSKERYLKARVNPMKNNNQSDGHCVSDDAPVNMFMEYLVKSVINYHE